METTIYNDPVVNTMEAFVNEGYAAGCVIETNWFMKHFHIDPARTPEEVKKNDMIYAKYMGRLRSMMLKELKVALRSKPGIGQEVVDAKEQTSWAMKEMKSSLCLEISKAKDRLINIDFEKLSETEKQENSDAVAKLSFFTRKSVKQLGW